MLGLCKNPHQLLMSVFIFEISMIGDNLYSRILARSKVNVLLDTVRRETQERKVIEKSKILILPSAWQN